MPGARQDEGRKIIMKRLVRGEKGYVLIAALVVLVVLGLISGPLLSYMVSGLKAGHVFETGAAELYAADAGVQDAMWQIQNNIGLCVGSPTTHYTISDVNGKSVDVTVTLTNNVSGTLTYKITSIAVTDDGGNTAGLGNHTTVVAYIGVTTAVTSGFLDNAITSNGTVTIGSNSGVTGNVTYGTSISGNINGVATQGYLSWPSASDLSNFYLSQVNPDNTGPNSINLGVVTLPACYVSGDLHIDGNGGTLTLTGTLYVNGSLYCYQPGGHDYTINLNGQTVFVTGTADFPANHVNVAGPGCIIAVGHVNFQPGIMTSTDFVFVMSVTDYVNFQPQGTFYGSVAGNVYVDLQPGNALTWHPLGGTSLNVPASISGGGAQTVTGATITSYNVSRQ
jgi:Tfp pilus assembly protein PilX